MKVHLLTMMLMLSFSISGLAETISDETPPVCLSCAGAVDRCWGSYLTPTYK